MDEETGARAWHSEAIGGGLLLADDQVRCERVVMLAEQPVSSGSLVVAARALAKHSQAAFAAGDWDGAGRPG